MHRYALVWKENEEVIIQVLQFLVETKIIEYASMLITSGMKITEMESSELEEIYKHLQIHFLGVKSMKQFVSSNYCGSALE